MNTETTTVLSVYGEDCVSINEQVLACARTPVDNDCNPASQLIPAGVPRWVNWRYEPDADGAKPRKVPYTPHGRRANSIDPATWSTFSAVVAKQDGFDGIGVVFDGTVLGVDLDNVVQNGTLSHDIENFVAAAKTYCELSPSGNGLHLYFCLTEPLKLEANKHATETSSYECYTEKRYFTFTGMPWQNSSSVRTIAPIEALELLGLLGYPWRKPSAEKVEARLESVVEDQITDDTLLKIMFAAKNGSAMSALYQGDVKAYNNDDSSGDFDLCKTLAFYSGKNAAQIERLWLASPLGSREKTQLRQDYRKRTIERAIESCTELYSPSLKLNLPPLTLEAPHNTSNATTAVSMRFLEDLEILHMKVPETEWVIENLIAKGSVNMLSAPPNNWKSFIAQRMAMCVARGVPVFGEFEVIKMNVLYVQEEDTLAMVAERAAMLMEDGEAAGGVFYAVDTGKKINGTWAQEIIAAARKYNAGMVILDSLRALHTAKENDSDEMQPVMEHLKAIARANITVLFTHHHRKTGQGFAAVPENNADSVRGSSAILAAVFGHITCSERRDDGHYLLINQPKLKSAKKLEPFRVVIEQKLNPLELKTERIRFVYGGRFEAGVAAIESLSDKLMEYFRSERNALYTRKQLVEAGFGKNAEARTLRDALALLVADGKIIGQPYKSLSEAYKTQLGTIKPSGSATVYGFLSNDGNTSSA